MNTLPVQTKAPWRPDASEHRRAFRRPDRHYVPILQPHRGEMDALLKLPSSTRQGLTPLVEIATMKGEAADISPRSPLARIGETLQHAVGVDEVFFLDFNPHISGSVVMHLLQNCLMHGLNFIPVVRPERAAQGQAIVSAAGTDRGVAIRVSISPFTPTGIGVEDLIEETLGQTQLGRESADLFLDLGRLHGILTAEDVAAVLEEISDIHAWRNLVVCGTTMPPGFGQDEFALDRATVLLRREWELHLAIRALSLQRQPTFSDYGIQGAGRPDKGFRPIPNLRYTAESHTIVLRGNRKAPSVEQHAKLCAELLRRREFRGAGFSRGDEMIADCAGGRLAIRDQEVMRAIGTAHHLQLVTAALAAR